jgi:D-glycero-D-manno-heptose 1,7-bisphosphate phosphatase
MPPEPAARAVFVDRDGTLMEDVGYPSDPEQVVLLPGAAAAVRNLRSHGYLPVLVSNQSGVGRGMVTKADLEQVHRRLVEKLAEEGARLERAYYCLHSPEDGCECRKPAPGLIEHACDELSLSAADSVLVGNEDSDVLAGEAAGCRTVLLGADDTTASPTWRAEDWPQVVKTLLSQTG